MTDLPFKAHYTDDAGDIQCRAFATNAEAREFRATLVDGKLPKGGESEPQPEPKPAATPEHVDPPAKAVNTVLTPSTSAVLNGPKVEPSATGGNG